MYNNFLILILLILLNAFFSLAEVVLIAAKKARLNTLADQKNKRAETALYLINRPELFLSTVQIAITLISLVFGYFSLQTFQPYIEEVLIFFSLGTYIKEVASVVVAVLATYIVTLLAELVPKKIGIVYSDSLALFVAYPIFVCSKVFYPLVWVLSKSSQSIFRFLQMKEKNDNSFTEYEIKNILNESHKQGNIEGSEKEIIDRIFSLGDRNITSLMLHRQHLVYIQTTDTIKQARAIASKSAHYQYPVCSGDLDDIKGIVTLKQLYSTKDDKKKMSSIMQKPILVPESVSVYGALELMKSSRQKNCFVVDEYGSVEGMLTLTHILEAIVGDVAKQNAKDRPITELEDGRFLVDASLSFYDFLAYFDKEEYYDPEEGGESDEYDTVAGFLLYEMERIPNEGDQLSWRDFTFLVADMDGHKIDKLLVTFSGEKEKKTKSGSEE